MRLFLAAVIAAGALCSHTVAVQLQISDYRASPTDFSGDGDAALLRYFAFADNAPSLEAALFVGDLSPAAGQDYVGNPATGTTAILDLPPMVTIDPALAELTFDVLWQMPPPPSGQWGNGFFDFVTFRDASGTSLNAGVSASFDLSCSPSDLPCGTQVAISGPNLISLIDTVDDEIEIVIDYHDGDQANDLGDYDVTGTLPPAFTVGNFNLVVPEPSAHLMIGGLILIVLLRLGRFNCGPCCRP